MNGRQHKGVLVQSVARALDIIACFDAAPELGCSELAERMGLSKSTAYGLINTLAAYGYLEQAESKKYRLGLKLMEEGSLVEARLDVRAEARPFCRRLSETYRCTVHLASYADGMVVYIDKIDSDGAVVVYSHVGKRAPMHCTGVGKAILAFLPRSTADEIVRARPLERLTEHTITSPDALAAELARVRERGYATDDEEVVDGLCCIAAPIRDRSGAVAMAISISFMKSFITSESYGQAIEDVCLCARQISERMGYTGK